MNTEYVRLPADSTGKRIRHVNRTDIKLATTVASLSTLSKGDTLVGVTSGATGEIMGWSTELDSTYIHVTDTSLTFTAAETLTVNEVAIGTYGSSTLTYTPTVHIVDADNASYRQKVDKVGSSYVRYSDGDLGFDAFGHAQVSQLSTIDAHTFTYGDRPDRYYTLSVESGTVAAVPQESCLLFSTTTTSGSYIGRTSNQYYPYTPGIGTSLLMSFRLGDSGKANVVRRWGMYDAEDGAFFQLSGSILGVGIRNSSTGTAVDTIVNRSNFNGDTLDDALISEYILDITKYNIYFIDYQWLGAGRVRYGVNSPSGKRIILHTIENPNSHTVPYMRTGTLPIKLEQFNLNTAASTSEMRLLCSTVQKQSHVDEYEGLSFSTISNRKTITGSAYSPVMSFRPTTTYQGEVNHTTAFALDYEADVSGSPIILSVYAQPTLSGSTWTSPTSSYSSTEIDVDATSFTGGLLRGSLLMPSGVFRREIREGFQNSFSLLASGTQPIFTFVAKTTDPSGSAAVTLLVRWKEVR